MVRSAREEQVATGASVPDHEGAAEAVVTEHIAELALRPFRRGAGERMLGVAAGEDGE